MRGNRAVVAAACGAVLGAWALTSSAAAIVNGHPTERDWPFMAYLETSRTPAEAEEAAVCGASLVTPSHALTAAHCVIEPTGVAGAEVTYPGEVLSLTIGRRDKTAMGAGERINVKSVTVHEGYDEETNKLDVAILELEHPSTRQPILVAGPGEQAAFAAEAATLVLGWGYEYFDQPLAPDHLNEADLIVKSGAGCPRAGHDAAVHVCTHGPNGEAICFGDSGGPLIGTAPGGAQRLVGVVSWMDFDEDPCEEGSWSMFVRVGDPPIRDWLAARIPAAIAPAYAPAAAPRVPGTATPAASQPPVRRPATRRRSARARRAARLKACRRRAAKLHGRARVRALRRCSRRYSSS